MAKAWIFTETAQALLDTAHIGEKTKVNHKNNSFYSHVMLIYSSFELWLVSPVMPFPISSDRAVLFSWYKQEPVGWRRHWGCDWSGKLVLNTHKRDTYTHWQKHTPMHADTQNMLRKDSVLKQQMKCYCYKAVSRQELFFSRTHILVSHIINTCKINAHTNYRVHQ